MKESIVNPISFESQINSLINLLHFPDHRYKNDRLQTVELRFLTNEIKDLRHDSEAEILVRFLEFHISYSAQTLKDSERKKAAKRIASNVKVLINENEAIEVFNFSSSSLTLLRKIHGLSYIKSNGVYQYNWRELQLIYQKMNASTEI
ncbi:MAG: hypothetical protein MK198_14450 [Gracilimonas sp.]|uniref:hypothetical protein n=1 Tax=Gracilimonas sp. TaxID=1974203 RepID=UPI003751682F|nr:hypothetical protein [Gracilimonas sp.]